MSKPGKMKVQRASQNDVILHSRKPGIVPVQKNKDNIIQKSLNELNRLIYVVYFKNTLKEVRACKKNWRG